MTLACQQIDAYRYSAEWINTLSNIRRRLPVCCDWWCTISWYFPSIKISWKFSLKFYFYWNFMVKCQTAEKYVCILKCSKVGAFYCSGHHRTQIGTHAGRRNHWSALPYGQRTCGGNGNEAIADAASEGFVEWLYNWQGHNLQHVHGISALNYFSWDMLVHRHPGDNMLSMYSQLRLTDTIAWLAQAQMT